ncbi:hypothetical protein GCM10023189_57280 [Nibrella saemangeumensis]|uniref:Dockerin type 1 n=1 Tax=Nibrella saemangeumensis TaxID=1084526 RepID=A0ABP8NRS2_9BACT
MKATTTNLRRVLVSGLSIWIASKDELIIKSCTMNIAAGDDGIHAETNLTINGGTISISKSYEGLEGKTITINDGTIHLVSSDDGINAPAGKGTGGGPMGSSSSSIYKLNINGGFVYVDANGDGLDANGTITITNGIVLVNGPTASGNGALDYDVSFQISGGFLLAVGSSGMAQAPGTTSTQNSVLVGLTAAQQAGTPIHIRSSDGKEIFTFKPSKKYQPVAFSSPTLVKGTTYDVYYGGSTTGTGTDGLYQSGTYKPGTKYTSFTVSSVVTKVNSR